MSDDPLSRHRPPTGTPGNPGPELGQNHFLPISLKGFDDGWNAYTHAMEFFDGNLYCGAFRANLAFKRRQQHARSQWPVWPIQCPEDPKALPREVDIRGRIYRYDPLKAEWREVHVSPMVTSKFGYPIPRECGFRGMKVFQGKSDSRPALYCTPFSNTESIGPVILRTEDGFNFEPVSEPGLGYEGISSFRVLASFKGRLYTSPIGQNNNVANTSLYPIIFESEDPATGQWREVSEPGFGDPGNVVVFFICVFDDHLYAGTANLREGFQLWKTEAEGNPPYHWEKVMAYGGFRGALNQGIASMAAFGDALYIGTGIQDGGYDRVNRIGPAAGEVLRVFPDGTWDVCVGAPRLTPDGVKLPSSGYYPGWNDLFNGYIWRMGVHDGRLYVGTAGWAVYLRYINLDLWPEPVSKMVRDVGIEKLIEHQGGCDLWSTADGDKWTPVTTSGFDNPFNMGARNIVSTPYGVAIGTANPFGPVVAMNRGGELVYEDNPRGGTEVWLGASEHIESIRRSAPAGGAPGRTTEDYRLPPAAPGGFKATPAAERFPIIVNLLKEEEEVGAPFQLDKEELDRMRELIDLPTLCNDLMAEARETFDLTVRGIENIPARGSVLLVGNNPSVPLFVDGYLIAANALYTMNIFLEQTGRPVRLLAPTKIFELSERLPSLRTIQDKFGLVPATSGNARRLLEQGEVVLVYPEERASFPPYRTRPFSSDYARMALDGNATIVPVAFLGTHESHMLIEYDDQQIRINKRDRMAATYTIVFLPEIDIGDHVTDPDSEAQLADFSELLRDRIQDVLDRESHDRPLVRMARTLQETLGTSEPVQPAESG